MHNLDQLFVNYDKSRPVEPLFTCAKYGFEWLMDDGIIFYPEGYLSRSRAELLHCIYPEIPFRVCDDSLCDNALPGQTHWKTLCVTCPKPCLSFRENPSGLREPCPIWPGESRSICSVGRSLIANWETFCPMETKKQGGGMWRVKVRCLPMPG